MQQVWVNRDFTVTHVAPLFTIRAMAIDNWQLLLLSLAGTLFLGCSDAPVDPVIVQHLASPAGPHSAQPHLAADVHGEVVLSWVHQEHSEAILRYSVLDDGKWRQPHDVARGENWFVNWADFPSVMPTTPGLWAAHWLVKRPGGAYAYDIAVALSVDGGGTWGEAVTPHTDGTATEHGFVSLFAWEGAVGALWLDGRNMSTDGHDETTAPQEDGNMTLRSVRIDSDRRFLDPLLLDDRVCDCCQTDVAILPDGPVVAYRNRSSDEVRDIYIARAVHGRWQPPQPVAEDGWKISGCPVNGPAIAADQSRVAVAWFTGAGDAPRVRLARSNDRGASFGTPIDVDAGAALGRVDVEWLDDNAVAVSWLRTGADGDGELCVRRVDTNGNLSRELVVAKTGADRFSGFPQMIRSREGLLFAWTATSGRSSTVETALLEPDTLAWSRRGIGGAHP